MAPARKLTYTVLMNSKEARLAPRKPQWKAGMLTPRRVFGVVAVAAAAVLLAACSAPAPSGDVQQASQDRDVPRVSLEEAKAALDAGAAIFLDVRSQQLFEAAHIPGALNIPLAELEARLGELDKAEWIITYCT